MTRQSQLEAPLAALAARLDARLADLADEVAHYPSPIARCDEQLTKLLEQRSDCVAHLGALRAIIAGDAEQRVEATRRLLASYGHPDDDEELALVSRLRALVAAGDADQGLRAETNHVDEGAHTAPSPRT